MLEATYFSVIFLAHANFIIVVSNINKITTDTIYRAITKEDLSNLILNAIKSTRNIKKRTDCSIIYDYLSKLLPNLRLTKRYLKSIRILNKQQYT